MIYPTYPAALFVYCDVCCFFASLLLPIVGAFIFAQAVLFFISLLIDSSLSIQATIQKQQALPRQKQPKLTKRVKILSTQAS